RSGPRDNLKCTDTRTPTQSLDQTSFIQEIQALRQSQPLRAVNLHRQSKLLHLLSTIPNDVERAGRTQNTPQHVDAMPLPIRHETQKSQRGVITKRLRRHHRRTLCITTEPNLEGLC